jgi:hypothetical protein
MNLIGQFVFVSWHGRLLQAHSDGEMHASQEVQNAGTEERWNVYGHADGTISLQNFGNNRWLCAEPSGKAICDRENPDIWEKWTLYSSGDAERVNLRSYHGKWLCAQPPGQDTQYGGEVIADRDTAATWERFSMIPSAGMPINNQSWWNDVSAAIQIAGQVAPIIVAAAG